MHIQKKGSLILDTDLLERLAFKQGSGSTISKKEAQTEINKVKRELKSTYKYTTSKASFARAEKAIANTFNLAIKSGWVKGTTAKSAITEFIKGDDHAGLKCTLEGIREDARSKPSPRSSYSSYRRNYGS